MVWNEFFFNFLNDDNIEYRTMFWQHSKIDYNLLTNKQLKSFFNDLLLATRVALMEKKKKVYNLLYNLLWLDRINDFWNWEYCPLKTYNIRLFPRFKTIIESSPSPIKSFLKAELRTFTFLLNLINDNQIVCLNDFGQEGKCEVLYGIIIDFDYLGFGYGMNLKEILIERLEDKISFLNTLLESFLNKIPFQNHRADSDPNSNTTFNSVVNISNYIHLIQNNINQTNYIYSPNILSNTNNNADGSVETKQTSTTNNKFWDDLSINNDALKNDHQPNENITEKNKSIYDELFDEYKTKYKNAIVGDELIKMFVFLEQNVKLKTRRNSDPNVIKYSAIYFILKEKIQEEIKRKIKSSENTDWYINKKELGNILDLTLKNSKKEITKQHLSVVRNFLNDYK